MNVKDQTMRLAAIKALYDAVGELYNQARSETKKAVSTAYTQLGVTQLQVQLPNGTHIATVSITTPKNHIDIDNNKLIDWVTDNHPTEIVHTVREPFRKTLMARLKIDDGRIVDTTTGEVVSWAQPQPTQSTPGIALRYTEHGREDIAQAYRDNKLSDIIHNVLEAAK